jgi:hypothetical protein
MHVVARQVQTDKALKDDAPSGPRGSKEDEKAGCGAAVGDHVKYSAESGGLVVPSRSVAIERIQQA